LNHRWDGLHGLKALKALDDTLDDASALRAFAERLERLRDRLRDLPKQLLVVGEAERQDCWWSVKPSGRTPSLPHWPRIGQTIRLR